MMIVKCEAVKKYFPVKAGYLRREAGVVKAVDGVSLEIEKARTLGLVGESGCGKTTLGRMMIGIIKPDSGKITRGTEKMNVIFQDPYNSLDPKMRIFDILAEGMLLEGQKRELIKERVQEMTRFVKLPANCLAKYPHQFSGGERQRIAIARAVLTKPEFIVCDEPVSSLDITVQLQVLTLLRDIQRRFGITYLFISHDLRVIKFMSDFVAVMKDGRIVESGNTKKVYSSPSHPYTKTLLSSIPKIPL